MAAHRTGVWNWSRPSTDTELVQSRHLVDRGAGVLGKYPRLVDTRCGRDGADPFVMACALTGSPIHTVVPQEQGGTLEKP